MNKNQIKECAPKGLQPSKAKSRRKASPSTTPKPSPFPQPPPLFRVTSSSRTGSEHLTWIAIDRAKPTVDYASALPASLVDSAAARRCVDQLFTAQESEALVWKLYGASHSMVMATDVELPLSREAVEQMSSAEGTGDLGLVRRVRLAGNK